jgi:hypothetical protein
MTTHRRYHFIHPGLWTQDGAHAIILGRLQAACERHWWYNEPEVSGQPFNRLSFEFTASGRDQWWCHVRAMNLARSCYHAIGLREDEVPDPMWEPLEPHTNRGRYRLPAGGQEE